MPCVARIPTLVAATFSHLLAVVLCGQVFFAAARFYWGIEHIGRMCWGMMVVLLPVLLWQARRDVRWTLVDTAATAVMAVVVAGFVLHGAGPWPLFMKEMALFALLPYLAGRLLPASQMPRFLHTATWLGAASIPLVLVAFSQLPDVLLYSDRPYVLERSTPEGLVHGYSYAFLTMGIGTWLVLSYAARLAPVVPPHFQTRGRMLAWAGVATVGTWLVMAVGLRSGLMAVALTVGGMVCLTRGEGRRQRMWVVAVLGVSFVLALLSQSPERFKMMMQILRVFGLFLSPMQVDPNLPAPNWPCMVLGDSVATRIHYVYTALKLFLEAPVFGIGVGGFGMRYCDVPTPFASPHSQMLHVLTELGLLGAGVWLVWMGTLARGLRVAFIRADVHTRGMLWRCAALCGFVTLWAQMNSGYMGDLHFYAFTGLLTAGINARCAPEPCA